MVGRFSLKGSQKAIRYLNDDGVLYFVFDDVFTYIKKKDADINELNDLLNLIEGKYLNTYEPDGLIYRNEAYIIGEKQEKVVCISKYGIISIKDVDEYYDINKLLTLIEYINSNF